jgi:hypothetical protein
MDPHVGERTFEVLETLELSALKVRHIRGIDFSSHRGPPSGVAVVRAGGSAPSFRLAFVINANHEQVNNIC